MAHKRFDFKSEIILVTFFTRLGTFVNSLFQRVRQWIRNIIWICCLVWFKEFVVSDISFRKEEALA
jgi:hypothetical protein